MFRDDGTIDGHGQFVQVSRLGNPLINEVVIPLGQKDYWNREDPSEDSQFEHFYSTPEVSHLENVLYGTPPQGHAGGALAPIQETGRTDLDLILLTGVPGPEQHRHDAGRPAPAEHGDQARRERRLSGRSGQRGSAGSARSSRRRPVRLPERPPSRRTT